MKTSLGMLGRTAGKVLLYGICAVAVASMAVGAWVLLTDRLSES